MQTSFLPNTALQQTRNCVKTLKKLRCAKVGLSCGFQAPTFSLPHFGPADFHAELWYRAAPPAPTPRRPCCTPVTHRLPECRRSSCLSKGVALQGGVAATLASVALHCATTIANRRDSISQRHLTWERGEDAHAYTFSLAQRMAHFTKVNLIPPKDHRLLYHKTLPCPAFHTIAFRKATLGPS